MSTLDQMRRSTMQDASNPASASAPRMPTRRVERNKSGGLPGGRRRAAPKRSQSHKIGRPVFNKDLPPEPTRGVNRNISGRLRGAPNRAAPNRSRSFGRSVPNRSTSTGSLKAHRKQPSGAAMAQNDIPDGDSVCDSVFTSASNQTLDSIMLRKKQIVEVPGVASAPGMRRAHRADDSSMASFDFDESLHTVDSINLHHKHATEGVYDDQCDLSVFSESFASTDTYCLSDYDEEEGNIKEEIELEDDFEEVIKEEQNNDSEIEGMKE